MRQRRGNKMENQGKGSDNVRDLDIREVNIEKLRDIREVKIDGSLDKEEKRRDFIRQIENPCLYRQGEYIVSLKFADTDVTLEERLLEYLERSEGEDAPWELLH